MIGKSPDRQILIPKHFQDRGPFLREVAVNRIAAGAIMADRIGAAVDWFEVGMGHDFKGYKQLNMNRNGCKIISTALSVKKRAINGYRSRKGG